MSCYAKLQKNPFIYQNECDSKRLYVCELIQKV